MASSKEHLRGVDESYFEHMRHASGYGIRLIRAGLACFLHAIVPARCETRASDEIFKLHDEMQARRSVS